MIPPLMLLLRNSLYNLQRADFKSGIGVSVAYDRSFLFVPSPLTRVCFSLNFA